MTFTELHWTVHAGQPLLALLQGIPLLAALLMLTLRNSRYTLPAALTAAVVQLILTLYLSASYDLTSTALQFAERLALPGPFDTLRRHVRRESKR